MHSWNRSGPRAGPEYNTVNENKIRVKVVDACCSQSNRKGLNQLFETPLIPLRLGFDNSMSWSILSRGFRCVQTFHSQYFFQQLFRFTFSVKLTRVWYVKNFFVIPDYKS